MTTRKNNETKKKSSEIKPKHLKTRKILKTQQKLRKNKTSEKKTTQKNS